MSGVRVSVAVLPVPRINSLVLLVRLRLAKVGEAPLWIFWGRERVISPVAPETVT